MTGVGLYLFQSDQQDARVLLAYLLDSSTNPARTVDEIRIDLVHCDQLLRVSRQQESSLHCLPIGLKTWATLSKSIASITIPPPLSLHFQFAWLGKNRYRLRHTGYKLGLGICMYVLRMSCQLFEKGELASCPLRMNHRINN